MTSYHPCRDGIHICGMDHDHNAFYTRCNYHGASKALYDSFEREFKCSEGEPEEFIVDFYIDGSLCYSFPISRQMVDRVARQVEA